MRRALVLMFVALLPVSLAAQQSDRQLLEQIYALLESELGTRTIRVAPGEDLQAALNAARGGDVVELEPGATYEGAFVLPVFEGDRWATLRVAGAEALPMRCPTPADAGLMATIASPKRGLPPLTAPQRSHHWRLQGLRLTQTGGETYDLLRIGDGETARLEDFAHHFEIDRVLVDVPDGVPQRRGIGVNAADVHVHHTTVSNIKVVGDAVAIGGWNTPGRWLIEDSCLESSGENFLIGGSDPAVTNLVPEDIVFRRNVVTKRLDWRGQPWTVKNLLELKNARRVRISENVFKGTWLHGQSGYAIVLTPRNQYGRAPLTQVADVVFEHNVITDSSSGINILGSDNEQTSLRTERIAIRHNLMLLDRVTYGGSGNCFLIDRDPLDVVIDRNTCISDRGNLIAVGGAGAPGFVFTNNVSRHNAYGIVGTDTAIGVPTVERFFPGGVFLHNVIGGRPENYPYPATTLLPTLEEFLAQFVDPAGGNFELRPDSPWKGAGTDGQDLGADFSRLPR